MSRLGRKILIVVVIAMVLCASVVALISITMSSNFSHKLMMNEASDLANFAEKLVMDETENCWEDYELIHASGVLLSKVSREFDAMFEAIYDDELDFMAVFATDGRQIWASETYKLTFDITKYSGRTVTGLLADPGVGLCGVHIASDAESGTITVIGRSLADNELMEEIKEIAGAEIALFYNHKPYATTLRNAQGQPATTDNMNAKADKAIYTDQQPYSGRTSAQGASMYYQYLPGYDVDGNLVCAFFAGLRAAESDREFRSIVILVIVVSILIIIASFFVGVWGIRRLVDNPILEANKLANDMKSGELSKPDSGFVFKNDEVGDFCRNLQQTKRDISSYIADISSILSAMGEGDFTQKPSVRYIGDFSRIENSFAEIEVRLADIVGKMDASADGVRSGAGQIANGSQLLAEGTTRQATAIEELNATVANINHQVSATAENADRANELSSGCLHKVEEQNEQMRSMLAAMDEIRDKSAKISAIIKTIEDIAFQTNILSLNASVEAARAGAAGKGFAVVADEVRNLATKSAEAANNTNILISDTVKAVNEGVELAQRTADIMGEVIEQTKQTNEIIGEINTAAAAQAEAVTQVSMGISDISGVISENSATAEETAASCQELASQSNLLKGQVDMFKV